MNQNQVMRASQNMGKGTYGSQGERLQWSYYDTEKLAVGTLAHRYFTSGVGKPFTVGGNKNLSDSNVISDGMPSNQHFVVYSIATYYKPHETHSEVDFNLITQMMINTTLTLKITGKDAIFQVSLMELMGANFPVTILPSVAGDNINTNNTNIMLGTYRLNTPIVLAKLTRYEGLLEHHVAMDTALDDDKLMLSLQGTLQRLS